MRILFLTMFYQPDSAATGIVMASLAEELAEQGHDVRVVTSMPHYSTNAIWKEYRGKLWTRERQGKIPVHRVWAYVPKDKDKLIPRFFSYLSFTLLSTVAGLLMPRPDVIITPSPSPPLTNGVSAYLLGKLRGVPFVSNIQDIYPDVAIRMGVMKNPAAIAGYKKLEKFVYAHSSAITVISEGFRSNLLAKGVPGDKLTVIPNFVDANFISPHPRRNSFSREQGWDDKFVALFAGNVGMSQGLETVLEAAALLRDLPDVQFAIIGNGASKPALVTQVETMGLKNVQFLPYQPYDRVPQILFRRRPRLDPAASRLYQRLCPQQIVHNYGRRPASDCLGGRPQRNRAGHRGVRLRAADRAGRPTGAGGGHSRTLSQPGAGGGDGQTRTDSCGGQLHPHERRPCLRSGVRATNARRGRSAAGRRPAALRQRAGYRQAMKILLAAWFVLAALSLAPARAASPEDLVPRGAALYDAAALLSAHHLLSAGAPDATDLQGVTGRLYTRQEFADWVRAITDEPTDPRAVAALAFCRNLLGQELSENQDQTDQTAPVQSSSPALLGFAELEAGGRSPDSGGSYWQRHGEALGRARLLGILGRDGAYTVSLTNIYRQTRDHASVSFGQDGRNGADNPDILDGIDEAYVTATSNRGLRVTLGELRQRWGSGYQGDMMVSDNAPSRPTLQVELPFSLGHRLGDYRFTQFLSTYNNNGQRIYRGARRLEHPLGDRTELSVEEDYTSLGFQHAPLQVLPYYAYQKLYLGNNHEPFVFNYNFNLGLTVRPSGPGSAARVYGQFYIDDLQAPKGLGKGNITPRKIGYLLGCADTFTRSGTDFALEYAHTDRETYTKLPPLPTSLASIDGGLPQGYPIGPNGNEVFLRIGQRLAARLNFAVEARDRVRVSDDFPAPHERAVDLNLAYHLGAAQSIGLRYDDYWEDPYTGPALPAGSSAGGADYGATVRRRILAVSFLQGF